VVRGYPDFFRVVREKGVETRIYRRSGMLGPGESETLCDLPKLDLTIEHLEFSSNHNRATLFIYPYKAGGSIVKYTGILYIDGSGVTDVTPVEIHTNESIAWFELIYDTVNNRYKFGLGYPLRFSNGVKIMVKNADVTSAREIACEVILVVRG